MKRLLIFYPRDHRAAHEDEMLGVLYAAGKPGLRDAWDLALGGLRIRLRRVFGPGTADVWREALANAAVVLSLVLAGTTLGRVGFVLLSGPSVLKDLLVFTGLSLAWYPLIAVLVVMGLRWPAAVVAWGWAIYITFWSGYNSILVFETMVHLTPGILLAVLLTLAAGQRAAAARLGVIRCLAWFATGAAVMAWTIMSPESFFAYGMWPLITTELSFVILGVATGWFSRTPASARTGVLLLPAVPSLLGGVFLIDLQSGYPHIAAGGLLIALLALLAARQIRLRRA
ncbi:hypothetical protein J5X84_16735 [Streptosporangiaceae bacterium NEAU-GS5]|nr:hypothetical protein [Streptosporangiaceae bacterium NEAU-GS5]